MHEYWSIRATRLKVDIEHVKRQLNSTHDAEELAHLKELRGKLTEELMVALEGVEQFMPKR